MITPWQAAPRVERPEVIDSDVSPRHVIGPQQPALADRVIHALAFHDRAAANNAEAVPSGGMPTAVLKLIRSGIQFAASGQSKKAVATYDAAILKLEKAGKPESRKQIANALFNKGVLFGRLDRSEEAIAAY